MTERRDYKGARAPRPKRKRTEDIYRETGRTQKTRSETARRRAEEEDAVRQRALHRRRKRRRLRRRVYRILLAVLAVEFVLSAAMIARELLRHDALKGTWTLDESTAYVFDGQGGGTLRLPMGSYAFSYIVEDNVVTLDFADEALTDTSYSFRLGRKTMTLDTNTGTVYWLDKAQ